MPHHAVDERHDLSQTLRAAGPEAPTLCGDWRTQELAAHLMLRERSVVEGLGRLPSRRMQQLAEDGIARTVKRRPYDSIVDAFERGPVFSPVFSIPQLREAFNLLEYVIHHEDVRRTGDSFQPRADIPAQRVEAIWQRLQRSASFTMRSVPVGVRLVWPGHGEVLTRRAKGAGPVVTVTGDPVELALVTFGRQRVAQVSYDGDPAAVALVRDGKIAV
jgi:uncharacterized protein (TIGR03085 family)